jgi:hypothetical protein
MNFGARRRGIVRLSRQSLQREGEKGRQSKSSYATKSKSYGTVTAKETSMRIYISKLTMSAVIAGAGLLMAAAPASALSVAAYSGSASPAVTCLQETDGGVRNNCGGQINYDLPLTTNAAPGTQTIGLSTYNPGGGTFTCYLVVYGSTVAPVFGTPVSPPTGFSDFNLSVTIPTGLGTPAFMVVYCNVNAGGVIYDAIYSE